MPNVRTLATSSIFASLFIVLRAIPTFPILGVPGGRFSASDVILPLYGVVLGPLQGPLVVILGTLLGFVFKPPIFLFLDFLPPAVNTLIVGLISGRRPRLAVLTYVALLIAFMLGPFTLNFVRITIFSWEVDAPFHWLHLITLPLALALIRLGAVKDEVGQITWKRYLGYALLGTMGQHSAGSLLFQCVFGLSGAMNREGFIVLWSAVFWVYPIERVLLALFGVLVGVPAARVLIGFLREGAQKPS